MGKDEQQEEKSLNGLIAFFIIIILILPVLFINTEPPYVYTLKSVSMESAYEVEIESLNDFSHLLIPIGRLRDYNTHLIRIYIETENTSILGLQWDSNLYTPYSGVQEIKDETGTPWLNISKDFLVRQGKNVDIKMTIRVESKNYNQSYQYRAYGVNSSKWILPTKYIDNNHTKIIDVASNLNKSGKTRVELIKDILSFLHKNLYYRDENTSFGYNQTFFGETGGRASDTLGRGYGVCRHYSRLFVAICRALGIPARYVSGYKLELGVHKAEGHAWAEFLDEEQYWQVVEPQTPYQAHNSLLYFNKIHGPHQTGSLAEEEIFGDEAVIVSTNDEDELYMFDAFLENYDGSWVKNGNYYLCTTGLILFGYLILILASKDIQRILIKIQNYIQHI